MAATLMAASASTGTVLKPTPFLGQSRGTNANPLRDVVSMGPGKYTMVLSNIYMFILHRVWFPNIVVLVFLVRVYSQIVSLGLLIIIKV